MKWRKGSKSGNVEDRRSARIPGGAMGGIGGLLFILLLLISLFLGGDPSQILQGVPDSTGSSRSCQRSNKTRALNLCRWYLAIRK